MSNGNFFNDIKEARAFVVQSMATMISGSSQWHKCAELFEAMQAMSSLEDLKLHLTDNKFMYAIPDLYLHHELLSRMHYSQDIAVISVVVPKHMAVPIVNGWNSSYGLVPSDVKELKDGYFVSYKGDREALFNFARRTKESGEILRYYGASVHVQ